MPADIERGRTLRDLMKKPRVDDSPLGMNEGGRCPTCDDRGMIQSDIGIRYCMCPTGREKKAEWFAIPAVDRAPFENEVPTMPDEGVDRLPLRKRQA